jgi:FkbM family methyltransferase
MNKFKKLLKNIIKSISGYKLEGLSNGSFAFLRENVSVEFFWPSTVILKQEIDDEVESNRKIYDRLCQLRIATLLDRYQINVVIDVGANEGQFASELRRMGYQGKIISFEPISSVFEKLTIVASTDREWDVYNLALGKENSQQTIYIANDSAFSSLLKSNDWCEQEFGDESVGKREETVNVRRLEEVLPEIIENLDRARIYLKMDTQGYDLEVFMGLGEMDKQVLALQSEMSVVPIYQGMPHLTASISFFEQAGFGIAGMYPVSTEKLALRVVEFDCLMVRNAHIN